MSELVFLFSADADIQTAFEFYEAFQEGRGEVFMRHLDVAIGQIRTHPQLAPIFHKQYRHLLRNRRQPNRYLRRNGPPPRPRCDPTEIGLKMNQFSNAEKQ